MFDLASVLSDLESGSGRCVCAAASGADRGRCAAVRNVYLHRKYAKLSVDMIPVCRCYARAGKVRNRTPSIRNTQLAAPCATSNSRPQTTNPQPSALIPQPQTHRPQTLNPRSGTPNLHI
eukprot:889214-Rhodomonas_salina.2